MFTIGDFARYGRVSPRMLRHYDAIGLLRPDRTDPATGYRYYGAAQLGPLCRIRPDQGAGRGACSCKAEEGVNAERWRPTTTPQMCVPRPASPA